MYRILEVHMCLPRQHKGDTLAKYLAGLSAHLRIVKSATSKFPDVSLLITYNILSATCDGFQKNTNTNEKRELKKAVYLLHFPLIHMMVSRSNGSHMGPTAFSENANEGLLIRAQPFLTSFV
jgi:hypothetical protein